MSRRRTAPRGEFPRSPHQQLAAIGLGPGRRTGDAKLLHCEAYGRAAKCAGQVQTSLCKCFDPSAGHWEDIEPPEPSEWLDSMRDRTPDQSFKDFVESRPNRPDKVRHVIYLQPLCAQEDLEKPAFPLGPWPSWQALQSAVERFYAPLPVRALAPVPMQSLRPKPASRQNDYGIQWHAGQVLDALHASDFPSDAFAMLGVTMCDLYPRESWNFVYGLAYLTKRVGVFSFIRHVPPSGDDVWRGAQLLHRSTKTMLHEIGHMFGLKHCTWYNCLMRGSNGEGVEHQPNFLHLCPVCLRKLHWSIGFDIFARYQSLLDLYQQFEGSHEHFARDCEFLRSRLEALTDLPPSATLMCEMASWARGRSHGGVAQREDGRSANGREIRRSATVPPQVASRPASKGSGQVARRSPSVARGDTPRGAPIAAPTVTRRSVSPVQAAGKRIATRK